MTRIKRKTFIIKHFARIAEQTYLQKKTKYCDVSVTTTVFPLVVKTY